MGDLLEKGKVYRENDEGEGEDDSDRSDSSDSSDGEESQSESNDGKSDNESDQDGIIAKESSKPCPHCQSWNMSATASDAFDTITILFVPFEATTSQLTRNISKKPLPVVMTAVQLDTKNMKTSKVSLYFPTED